MTTSRHSATTQPAHLNNSGGPVIVFHMDPTTQTPPPDYAALNNAHGRAYRAWIRGPGTQEELHTAAKAAFSAVTAAALARPDMNATVRAHLTATWNKWFDIPASAWGDDWETWTKWAAIVAPDVYGRDQVTARAIAHAQE